MSVFLGVQMTISQARLELSRANLPIEDIGITIELPPYEWRGFLASAEMRMINQDAAGFAGNYVTLMGATVRLKPEARP